MWNASEFKQGWGLEKRLEFSSKWAVALRVLSRECRNRKVNYVGL